MTWWGVLILCVVCLASGGVITWLLMRRQPSDPVADLAEELIHETRESERSEEAAELEALLDENPFRSPGSGPDE
jgi:hypothetical protein